jgi:hypothetical protein
MQVLFCRPSSPQDVEDRFDLEALALDELGVSYGHLPLEAIVDDDLDEALAGSGDLDGPLLYRGWMLRQEEMERLAEALAGRGAELVVSPEAYEAAHFLPQWSPLVEDLAAPTCFTGDDDADEAWTLACARLGPPPWVVKDHVKSAKERWDEACFVPAGAGLAEFRRVCAALVDQRGERFEGGLVVRRFVPLAPAPTAHVGPRGEAEEYRLFFWAGRCIDICPQFDAPGDVRGLEAFTSLGRRIASPFFTADVARRADGGWLLVEIGDGGVSTLPPTMDVRAFYRAIAARWRAAL